MEITRQLSPSGVPDPDIANQMDAINRRWLDRNRATLAPNHDRFHGVDHTP